MVCRHKTPVVLACTAAAALVSMTLFLAGRPLATDDLWFHLKMGEIFATEGLWPSADPMLHTAHADAPVQHEWFFQVAVHFVEQIFGFRGLRVAHFAAAAAILGLVWSLFRRESDTRASAGAEKKDSLIASAFALSIFVVLAWHRLFQLRPDLVSIPAAFLLYRLLLETGRPASWRNVSAAVVLIFVWGNAHSLFGVGLLLLLAALAGLAVKAIYLGLCQGVGDEDTASLALARAATITSAARVAATLGLGIVATLLNPRGIEQHLTFFRSSAETAIWFVSDEWRNFDPFAFLDWSAADFGSGVSLLAVIATDAVVITFAVATVWGLVRLLRNRSLEAIEAIDPVRLALGGASIAALFISIRFLWMIVFPLLFILRISKQLGGWYAGWRSPAGWALALAAVGMALTFPTAGGFLRRAVPVQKNVTAYLSATYNGDKYFQTGVRFLSQSGLEGNLFNVYHMGAFTGYWVAPRIRTFIDGRVEHYPPDVLFDHAAITSGQGARPGEDLRAVLDRRNVNIFFGVGLPTGPGHSVDRLYTTTALERAGGEGWILVSRSVYHAIYLRSGPGQNDNLDRVAEYYERLGVPFDREHGLDVAAAMRTRPRWAVRNELRPRNYDQLLAGARATDPALRSNALQQLGTLYALLGLYGQQMEVDLKAAALRPGDKAPLRRLIFAQLHLNQPRQAVEMANRLLQLDPGDVRSRGFAQIARLALRADEAPPVEALLRELLLLDRLELRAFRANFHRGPPGRSNTTP